MTKSTTEFSSPSKPAFVLASGSRFRRQLLENAGLTFTVDPPEVDELKLKAILQRSIPALPADQLALALATAKADTVSGRHWGKLVLGSDQILALPAERPDAPPIIFSKPSDIMEARAHIHSLAGRTHYLHTAAVLARNETVVWTTIRTAALTMRPLTSAEINRYIARAGPEICDTVGGYMLEGVGAHLFEKIDGDYFTIIGLPLLDVLSGLRSLGQEVL
jgi:septum formation protein